MAIYKYNWNEVNINFMTNLYLYGTTDTPSNYEDRLRSEEEYQDPTILEIDMAGFMSDGPGRYANPSMFGAVSKFFVDNILYPITDSKGNAIEKGKEYSKEDLIAKYGFKESDFKTSFMHLDVGPDYADRVYIYNSQGFKLSDSTKFVIDSNGVFSIKDMSILVFNEDFNFSSGDNIAQKLVNMGNIVLESFIDPYAIGRTVDIIYLNKDNVANYKTSGNYNAQDYLNDVIKTAAQNNGSLVGTAAPAMIDVVSILKAAGTIDYDTDSGGEIKYGTSGSDNLHGTNFGDVIVTGSGNDNISGYLGDDEIYGGKGNDTIDGGLGNDHIYAGDDNDTILASEGNDVIDGGSGIDTMDFTPLDSFLDNDVDVNLTSGAATIKYLFQSNETQQITNIENVKTGGGDDNITGNSQDNILESGGGDDTLNGYGGNDILNGGADFDTYIFNGAYGFDTVIDSDQQGSVVINGDVLGGTAKTESSENSNSMTPIYKLSSGGKTYELTLSGSDLVIRDPDNIDNMITVKGFKNGSFGITLDEDTDSDDSGLDGPFGVFQGAVQSAIPPKDPLIVDVNGDGLKLSSWQSSGVKFDIDGNGTSESTGWTTSSSSNYEYVSGSGSIIIDEANANMIDRIVFGAGISKDDLTFSKVGVWDSSVPGTTLHYDLVITFKDNPNDKITILNYFRQSLTVWNNGIEMSLQFE